MQKVITIRASQADIAAELEKFVQAGWLVKSLTRGSTWTRFGFSYKWTVVLENNNVNADIATVERIHSDIQLRAAKKHSPYEIIIIIGTIIGLISAGFVIYGIRLLILQIISLF